MKEWKLRRTKKINKKDIYCLGCQILLPFENALLHEEKGHRVAVMNKDRRIFRRIDVTDV